MVSAARFSSRTALSLARFGPRHRPSNYFERYLQCLRTLCGERCSPPSSLHRPSVPSRHMPVTVRLRRGLSPPSWQSRISPISGGIYRRPIVRHKWMNRRRLPAPSPPSWRSRTRRISDAICRQRIGPHSGPAPCGRGLGKPSCPSKTLRITGLAGAETPRTISEVCRGSWFRFVGAGCLVRIL